MTLKDILVTEKVLEIAKKGHFSPTNAPNPNQLETAVLPPFSTFRYSEIVKKV